MTPENLLYLSLCLIPVVGLFCAFLVWCRIRMGAIADKRGYFEELA